jgi:retron-type reverse transcriptase
MAVQSYSADADRVRKRSGSSEYGLAIGAPASPIISNIVMYDIDNEIIKYTKQNEASYTRYSDDIIYSSGVKGECVKFATFLGTLLSQMQSPKLEINKEKTIFMSQGTRKTVTGLTICPDGRISLGRKKKRLVSAMVHRAMKKKLPAEGKSYLKGYLSFILSVEPDFYDRLILKYGGEIIKQLHYS